MDVVHFIHYYDKFGTIQRFQMSSAFDMWVESKGGKRSFIEYISRTINRPDFHHTTIAGEFIDYFRYTVGELVDDYSILNQDYIYDSRLYEMYFARVVHDHKNRSSNPQTIITIIILALATIGLVSMCK